MDRATATAWATEHRVRLLLSGIAWSCLFLLIHATSI
jgi:hypothetical protein